MEYIEIKEFSQLIEAPTIINDDDKILDENIDNTSDSYKNDNKYESDGDNDDVLVYDYLQLDKARNLLDEHEEDNDDDYISDTDDDVNITEEESETREIPNNHNTTPKKQFTSCVIIDNINGEIKQCKSTSNLRRLGQLIGSWEIDRAAVKNCEDSVKELGVCHDHFLYDQNSIHSSGVKQSVNIEKSLVQFRRCIFCEQNKAFFTRGKVCIEHCWNIIGKNVQVPCNAQYKCKVFSPFGTIASKTKSIYRPRFICCSCFNLHGGHLEPRPRKGPVFRLCNDHANDVSSSLHYISKWILEVAYSNDQQHKEKVLNYLVPALAVFNNDSPKFPENIKSEPSESTQPEEVPQVPCLLLIKTILKLAKVNLTDEERVSNLTSEEFYDQGKTLGLAIWKNKNILLENSEQLAQPASMEEYINAFPSCLTSFVSGMIGTLYDKKQHQCKNRISEPNDNQTMKTTAFLSSVIITHAFKKRKVWLTQILATLCHKPKLSSSLYEVLLAGGVLPHTIRHERRCENELMLAADPRQKLICSPTVWSVGVMDNIDFKESTFFSGNIFDATRNTVHATARMVLQFDLQEPLSNIREEPLKWTRTFNNLFGPSRFIEEWNDTRNIIFSELLKKHGRDLDVHHIHDEITHNSSQNSTFIKAKPDVIILSAGPPPNSDKNVFTTCDLFREDLLSDKAETNKCLLLFADEAIFRKLVQYNKKYPEVIPMLGQFHTNREMLIVLISAFSGYGIFNLAAKLGTKFLDKLDHVVDYRATCRTIELLWVAVGIAIHLYTEKNELSVNDIMQGDNDIVKVWYLFYQWAGYWKGHKVGIRTGNFNMQIENLAAFAPLFPVTGKYNYHRAVVNFLAYLCKNPDQVNLLWRVCSVNLTRENHYYGVDETMEIHVIKYIKQNISHYPTSTENLMKEIKSMQSRRERLDTFLSEFLDDNVKTRSEKAIFSRKESLWQLIDELCNVFDGVTPLEHSLLKDVKELHDEGLNNIFTCYDKGLKRLYTLLNIEVLQNIKTNASSKKEITAYKWTDLNEETKSKKKGKKMKEKSNININDHQPATPMMIDDNKNIQIQSSSSASSLTNPSQAKKTNYMPSQAEKEILGQLASFQGESLPETLVLPVLESLLQLNPNHWNNRNVRDYWRRNLGPKRRKKKNEMEMDLDETN